MFKIIQIIQKSSKLIRSNYSKIIQINRKYLTLFTNCSIYSKIVRIIQDVLKLRNNYSDYSGNVTINRNRSKLFQERGN